MQGFIEIYGFLVVVLRGFALAAQSLTIGGVGFLALLEVTRARSEAVSPTLHDLKSTTLRVIVWTSAILVAAELLSGFSLAIMLMGAMQLSADVALSAEAVVIDLAAATIGICLFFFARRAVRSAAPGVPLGRALGFAAAACVVLVATQAVSTHAASRPEGAGPLLLAEVLHMSAVGVWIGGIPYFLIALWLVSGELRAQIARGFSLICVGAVAALLASGLVMAFHYVQPVEAVYGTSYGVMLTAKILLLLSLLLLGGMNFLTTEKLAGAPQSGITRLRSFAEVEIGIGFTALFCAASLTSLPPAADFTPAERASLSEVVDRLAPHWPVRLDTPDHAELSVAQPRAATDFPTQPPRTPQDIAWSEYNHHWAGIFVIAMGVLALMERSAALRPVARHWPLVFLGLAAFLFLRADEGVWPLGDLGLIESLRDPEIAQHRLFVVLIIAFAIFEWRVRTGRNRAPGAALVFPLTTAVGAAFLLIHSHGLANPKEELLIEVTHTPLAIMGVTAGWARWLELRATGRVSQVAAYVWPIAFVLAGLLLFFYREA
jgi:putative copper resistance protein D